MAKSLLNAQPRVEKEKEFLLNLPEIHWFIACRLRVNELRGLERAFEGEGISEEEFLRKAPVVLERLSQIVALLEEFGLVRPVLNEGRFSPSFWRWFNWWEDYFHELTPSEIAEIGRLGREQPLAVKDYRPKNHWASYRHTPALGDVRIQDAKAPESRSSSVSRLPIVWEPVAA